MVVLGVFPLVVLSQMSGSGEGTLVTKQTLDTLWVLFCAYLVFWMNAGFAMVESGFTRSKNTVNILAKNFIVFGVSTLGFYVVGWGLMFGDGSAVLGLKGVIGLSGSDNSPAVGELYNGVYSSIAWAGVPLYAKFFFQLVFAGTAATIVSGAVGERIKFMTFIAFSFLMVTVVYPVVGHWIWGGGWLQKKGMLDFAGSTVVHSVGGWAGLTGAVILGARAGRYDRNGKVNPMPGHSMSNAALGGFILWLGWFGFNAGSTMSADVESIARIALATNMAASAGTVSAAATAWIVLGKPDFSMIVNGALAGLVAITAPCAFVSIPSSIIIGLIAGVLVILSVVTFDKIEVDDPVGAISVHLVNGVFGTLCVAIFGERTLLGIPETVSRVHLLGVQALGVVSIGLYVAVTSTACWLALKALLGLRVSPEEELEGLDIGEHGMEAYHIGEQESVRAL